jgi:hypothetical protein
MSNETPMPQKSEKRGDSSADPNEREPVPTVPAPGESVAVKPGTPEPVYDLVEVAPAATSESEPVIDTPDPAAAETTVIVPPAPSAVAPASSPTVEPPQTIYVNSPVPPSKKGNRGFGVLIALLSSVVFAGLYALAIAAIHALEIGVLRFDFFGSLAFYTPVAFFFVGFVIVVLLANRASWWSYVLGSIFVGFFVYSGSIGTGLLANNVFALTPSNAAQLFSTALTSPFIIAAALLAREVSMWMGAIISSRGRKVKVRNIEAREIFDRESAARTAEYENSRYRAPDSTV